MRQSQANVKSSISNPYKRKSRKKRVTFNKSMELANSAQLGKAVSNQRSSMNTSYDSIGQIRNPNYNVTNQVNNTVVP